MAPWRLIDGHNLRLLGAITHIQELTKHTQLLNWGVTAKLLLVLNEDE